MSLLLSHGRIFPGLIQSFRHENALIKTNPETSAAISCCRCYLQLKFEAVISNGPDYTPAWTNHKQGSAVDHDISMDFYSTKFLTKTITDQRMSVDAALG